MKRFFLESAPKMIFSALSSSPRPSFASSKLRSSLLDALPKSFLRPVLLLGLSACATEEAPVKPFETSEIDFNPYAVAQEPNVPKHENLPAPPQFKPEADEPKEPEGKQKSTVEGTGPEVRYIASFQLNVRTKPNRFAPIIRNLDRGTEVHVKMMGDWAELNKGEYIRTRHLKKTPLR